LLEGGRGAVKEEFGRNHILEFKGPFFSFIFLDSPLFLRCGPLNLTDVKHACGSAVNSLGSGRGRGSGTKNWVAGLETKATGTRRFTAIASTRTTHGGAIGLNLPHLVQKLLKRGTPT
jgi:hypothetical protein